MSESILNDMKKSLGMYEYYNDYDTDLILHINSIISKLKQIGVPSGDFMLTDTSQTWEEYLPDADTSKLAMVKTYMTLSLKKIFDPPQSSFLLESINNQLAEFEWRIYTETGGY